MLRLRRSDPRDLQAFHAISLATGLAGGDASHLYEDGKLIGHIYSAPYLCLEPDLALVVEDDEGVGGFAVGVLDTASWENRLELAWWPDLRKCFPCPTGAPAAWTADERRCAMIRHPEHVPVEVVRNYPAHLHLNLLPRLQRRGIGLRLLEAWLDLASGRGAGALHVGVNFANTGAVRFWTRHGFHTLATAGGAPRAIWMGRCILDQGCFIRG